jgi:predicted HTH transcriptional regulator
LNKTQKSILGLITQNNQITIDEISNILKKEYTSVWRAIKKLQELKVIKRIGSDKTGHWEVVG